MSVLLVYIQIICFDLNKIILEIFILISFVFLLLFCSSMFYFIIWYQSSGCYIYPWEKLLIPYKIFVMSLSSHVELVSWD